MRHRARTRWDRFLAAVEISALGLWLGALCGFAFINAPLAFHLVPNVHQFAALTAGNLRALGTLGDVCGGFAIFAALLRAREAADRRADLTRAGLVMLALACAAFQALTIVPAMAAIADVKSVAYHALHNRSTMVYGGVVLCGFGALILAAIRDAD